MVRSRRDGRFEPESPAGVVRRAAPLLVACALLAAPALAHGGQYRGTPIMPPATGGPGGPGPSGPSTGGRTGSGDGASWQVWWEYNKDDLMAAGVAPAAGPVSGSDEFFLGVRRDARARDNIAPTDADRRDRIAAALARALGGTDNRDIVTACMVGLAKVGIDPDGGELGARFARHLAANDQEVRETATLAYGIAGLQSGFATLDALLRGDAAGRELTGGKDKEVPDRTRAFAAWSLGLLGGRSRDPALKRAVADRLLAVLFEHDERSRDLRVGLVEGLGLLAPEPERSGAEKLLLWRLTAELWRFYEQDLGKANQVVQAHVPIAVARLLGRGRTPEHQRAKAILAADLTAEGRTNHIRQSAAIALGSLCLAAEDAPDDAEFAAALVRSYQRGTDQFARFASLVALGRIGGDANRSALLTTYVDANKTIEKPWAAIALGLVARDRARRAGDDAFVDTEVGRLLLRDVEAIEFDEARAGIALALGLCGYRDAAPTLATLLRGGGRNDTLLGHLAIAEALLGCGDVADDLVALMQKSLRRPELLLRCAQALGRLGDARTVPTLLDMLDQNQSTAGLSAVATALAKIKDRRSIDPLVHALEDGARTDLARAFAAAALGGIGDKDALPWNARIARDMNYAAVVDTLTNGSSGVLDIL